MSFNPSHCEQCGQSSDEYFPSGVLVVCGTCADPETVSGFRTPESPPHRRYPGQTNRERNSQLRDEYLEETSCECGEYQPHFLKFYGADGRIASEVSDLVDRGVSQETLAAAMASHVVQCRKCHAK